MVTYCTPSLNVQCVSSGKRYIMQLSFTGHFVWPCAVVQYVYKVMGERPDHLNHTSSKKGLAELSGR